MTTNNDWQNQAGSSKITTPPGGWLKYWESKSGKAASKCAVKGCEKTATDGGHIINSEKHTAITPLCEEHNNPTNTWKGLKTKLDESTGNSNYIYFLVDLK
ncbi:hypothetical protein AGMMS49944_24930 [Spirochaetia bacterium]|nr:hypothetical protein AGMMS49944_24930 [Spirochaetia bacterium]